MAGERSGIVIKVGGYEITPLMVRKDGRVLARGDKAARVWTWVSGFDISNPLVKEELLRVLEEWFPE